MGQKPSASLFSYSLTRKYPFRWFTYVVFIALTVCATLFSFVALAADGYEFDFEYTLHLDQTLNKPYWFQKPPLSWISKTQLSCQPALLTTGSTYFTSNLGLLYTLDRLWQPQADLTSSQDKTLPAVAYQHTVLKDCAVQQIEVDFMRRDEAQFGNTWSWGLTTASATVTCTIEAPSAEEYKANFTTNLPHLYLATDLNMTGSFGLSMNVSENANLWFGSQFANAWYEQLSFAMSFSPIVSNNGEPDIWNSGTTIISRNPNVDDYTDLDFFYAWTTFVTQSGEAAYQHPGSLADFNNGLPTIMTNLDTFAKSLYSLILCDFGVVDKTNALLTPAGVRWLESQVDTSLRDNSVERADYGLPCNLTGRPDDIDNALNKHGPTYPINETYASVVEDLNGPPNLNTTTSSTIFTQYLCSIPKQKSGGALFFAVLLADLVFLKTVWALLNLAATWWVEHKYEDANCCDGCRVADDLVDEQQRVSNEDEYQLLPAVSVGSLSLMKERDPGSQETLRPAMSSAESRLV